MREYKAPYLRKQEESLRKYGYTPQSEEEPLWEKQQREKEEEIKRRQKEQEEDDYLICDVSCNDIYSCF